MARIKKADLKRERENPRQVQQIMPPEDKEFYNHTEWKDMSIIRIAAIKAQHIVMNDLLLLREANFEEKTPEFYQAGKAALIAAKELAVNIDSAVRARFYIPQPEDTDQASEVLKHTNSMINMHEKAYASSAIEVIE